MPIHPNTPQCQHIKTSGSRCGSPALQARPFCYFHNRAYLDRRDFRIPLIEDAESLQLAINEVLRGLFSSQITPDEARLALYGLRISAINMPRTYFKPLESDPPTIDSIPDDLFRRACTVALDRARSISDAAASTPADSSAPADSPAGPSSGTAA